MRLGDFQLHVVSDGGFKLDGGSMFGVVPRVLWEKKTAPDDHNRIRMGTNCLLVESPDGLVLIDTGIGDKNDDKFRDMFGMEEGAARLPASIESVGFGVEDIQHVVLTHLHFDHCGWNTRRKDNEIVPTFPNAAYWLEEGEVAYARAPTQRDRASYDKRNWEPLFEAGVAREFRDEAEPVAGVKAIKARGHTADMCVVMIESRGEKAVFWADLVPTTAHLPYPWIMGFDLYPVETMENKQSWLPKAHAGDWICFFEHDPDVPCARLVEDKPGRFAAEPVAC